MIPLKDRLIIALDVPDADQARAMVRTLGNTIGFYKIGLELAIAGGLSLARELNEQGRKVFLDLKLHDIGNTVERATARAAELGATFLTVHAYRQTMQAAVRGRTGQDLKILAVTILTSWDEQELHSAGLSGSIEHTVRQRALLAQSCGVDGIVASAQEASSLRQCLNADMHLVTPGIRPASAARDDQSRTMTPAQAIQAGVDYLVVGRPVIAASDPRAAAQAILEQMQSALC